MKGIYVDIYKNSDGSDCTNDGMSSTRTRAFYPCERGNMEPEEGDLILKVVHRKLQGEDYYHAEPDHSSLEGKSKMFGGNMVYSSDSRFNFLYPLKLHDRVES